MKKSGINKAIDSAAESAQETIELFAEKLDEATQCGEERMDQVHEHVTKAANEIRKAAEAVVGKEKN